MLHVEDASRQCLRRVPGTHGHGPLGDDRPAVVLLIHVVHGRARDRGAAREYPLVHATPVHPGAAEGGQQRRMDINHPQPKAGDRRRRHLFEIPGQHHEPGVTQACYDLSGVTRVGEHGGRHPGPARSLERARRGVARDDAGDAGDFRIRERIEQRLQVRAGPRDEHRDADRPHRGQGVSDLGFAPTLTLSENGPVASLSVLVTTIV